MKHLLYLIAIFALVATSCRTPRHVTDGHTEVHQQDTVYVTRVDTVRLTVETSGVQAEREVVVQRVVTVYDTLGRVRTVVQEDKASRLVANYYRSLYDSLRFELIELEARHRADSLLNAHEEEPVKVETWRDRLSNALTCLFGMALLVIAGALLIMRMLKKET